MKALVTGVSGMDGSILAELLLDKGYEVHGLVRHLSNPIYRNIEHILDKITLHQVDITDSFSVGSKIHEIQPHECYNLAAQSHIGTSWETPLDTMAINGMGAFNVMEAIRLFSPQTSLFTAITAEIFGVSNPPQNESTPLNPNSPYACSKAFAYLQSKNYRERYGLKFSTGILFNHTSSRRPEIFVPKKITASIARILKGTQDKLELGNIDVSVDMGFAPDFVKAYHLITSGEVPDDFVIGTGETHTIKEFCEIAFKRVNLRAEDYIVINPKFYRPLQNSISRADISKIKSTYGWEPSISFEVMVNTLMDNEL